MVCAESTMAKAGLFCSISPNTVDRSVVEASNKFGSTALMREARKRTCACDSSPEMYSTVLACVDDTLPRIGTVFDALPCARPDCWADR